MVSAGGRLKKRTRNALRKDASELASSVEMSIDIEAYRKVGRDPMDALLGGGNEDATLGFFGRDPGRDEVRHMEPLIGAGGKLIRRGVYRHVFGMDPPDFEAEREVAKHVFFSNTVPYKPVGNKAWSMGVKRHFQPLIAEYLVDHWAGRFLIPLGNVAFHWFGIGQSKDTRNMLKTFWDLPDRYERRLNVSLVSPRTASAKEIVLLPLPHPSPLNATWHRRFPDLLATRLRELTHEGVGVADPRGAC